jgi:tetratricopeptide (TPR) repeat protein
MKNTILFLLMIVVILCRAQQSTFNLKAIELNNKAVNLIAKSFGDDTPLNNALLILDQAIKIDSSYYVAYQSKATVLCKLKKYESAIKTLDKVIQLHKNVAEVFSTQGFILEKIGRKKEAIAKYKSASNEYDRLIKKYPNKVEYQINKAFLLVFIDNKETAQKSIKEIIKKYPENKNAKAILFMLNSFDRKQYIELQ